MYHRTFFSFVTFVLFVVNSTARTADSVGTMTPDQFRAAGFVQLAANDSLDDFDMKPWHQNHWTSENGAISHGGKDETHLGGQKTLLWAGCAAVDAICSVQLSTNSRQD